MTRAVAIARKKEMVCALSLEQAIGRGVRKERIRHGWTQADLVRAARELGLPWTRATVGDIELGRRDLRLGEALLLQIILTTGLATLAGAAAGEGPVSVAGVGVPGRRLADLLEGRAYRGRRPRNLSEGLLTPRVAFDDTVRLRYGLSVSEAQRIQRGLSDAETKAARRFGVGAFELGCAAFRIWGRNLAEERDRRLKRRDPEATTRGRRGRMTRELIEELRPVLKDAARK